MSASDRSFALASGICCLAGGLIGYGRYGSFQDACYGAGIGLLTPLATYVGLLLLSRFRP